MAPILNFPRICSIIIARAEELGAYAIIDDEEARSVAELYDIRTRPGTLYILFSLVTAGKLGSEAAEEKLDQMVNMGL